jgi:hypothetical protein
MLDQLATEITSELEGIMVVDKQVGAISLRNAQP